MLIHACLAVTIPFVLLPSKPTLSELLYFLQKSKATHIFVHPETFSIAVQAADQHGFPKDKIILFGAPLSQFDSKKDLEPHAHINIIVSYLKQRNVPVWPILPAEKRTLAYLLFSSGTGGMPKCELYRPIKLQIVSGYLESLLGVMTTHGNLIASMAAYHVGAQERAKILVSSSFVCINYAS